MIEELFSLWSNPTFQNILFSTTILGAGTGALGCFIFLRKESLLGDTMSHSALPGVVLAFLLTLQRDMLWLALGAFVFSLAGALIINYVIRRTRIDQDAAQAIILSSFFALGVQLLSWVQNNVTANKAGLTHYLFGQAGALTHSDLILIIVVMSLIGVVLILFWNRWVLISFDSLFGKSIGIKTWLWESLLMGIVVLSIVIGISVVGVVLMSALLVAPSAASRQWVQTPKGMVLLAAVFGGISGFLGTTISLAQPQIPTGPSIVVTLSFFSLLSLLLSPQRGILARWMLERTFQNSFAQQRMLRNMGRLGELHHDLFVKHKKTTLLTMDDQTQGPHQALEALRLRGLVTRTKENFYALTQKGVDTLKQGNKNGQP
jgi:manganese/zinc/iron transport system permease protein